MYDYNEVFFSLIVWVYVFEYWEYFLGLNFLNKVVYLGFIWVLLVFSVVVIVFFFRMFFVGSFCLFCKVSISVIFFLIFFDRFFLSIVYRRINYFFRFLNYVMYLLD